MKATHALTATWLTLTGCVSDFDPGPRQNDHDAMNLDARPVPDGHTAPDRGVDAETPPSDQGGPQTPDDRAMPDAGDAGGDGPENVPAGCRIVSSDPPGQTIRIHLSGWTDAVTSDSAMVSFLVTGLDGQPMPNVPVSFEVRGFVEARISPPDTHTDDAGRVTVTVSAASVPSHGFVRASAECGEFPVQAVSPRISASGGPPSLSGLGLSCTPSVLRAFTGRRIVDGLDDWAFAADRSFECMAQLADHFGDTIGPGIDVTFRTESGASPAPVPTDDTGRSGATLSVGRPPPADVEPVDYELAIQAEWSRRLSPAEMARRERFNPRDAVVRVVAITPGMEAFTDIDGDGSFTEGIDLFSLADDIGEPFVDGDDDGEWHQGEPFQDTDHNALCDLANGHWDEHAVPWRSSTVLFTGPPDAAVSWIATADCQAQDEACRPCRAESGCEPVVPGACDADSVAALRPGGEVDLQVVVADVNGNCPLDRIASNVRFPTGAGWVSEPESISGIELTTACFGGTPTEPFSAPLRFRLRDTRADAAGVEPEQTWLEATVTYDAGDGRPGELNILAPVCLLPSADAPGPGPDAAEPIADALPVDARPVDALPVDALPVDALPIDATVADVGVVDAGLLLPDVRVVDASPADVSPPDGPVADAAIADMAPPDAGVWAFPHHTTPFGGEFIGLPAGTFTMGLDQPGAGLIAHEVTLSRPFWLGRTEVTVADWHRAWLSNPNYIAWERPSQQPDCDTCPVEGVSWQDFARFANVVSDAEGLERCYTYDGDAVRAAFAADPYACPGYRFPTSAEWEYAARAGTGTAFLYPGSNDAGEIGWLVGTSAGTTHPVGQLMPNAWGLFDLCGNVAEYISEWAGPIPTVYSPLPATDPWGPPTGDPNGWVVFRGDHFRTNASPMWIPSGAVLPAQLGLNYVGARLARTMPPGP